ncbi:hypothetical protein [Lamprobacter modestohalophilus]|uniref:hypothetical protein n=1 Tax=Lamprobacter modestohalophilus TaxID=1064514 RepID=UPI0019051202|nr:hypothetical protein [Lamprobacter modestohalophilus]
MSNKTIERIERLLEGQDQRIRLSEDAIRDMRTYWRIAGAAAGIVLTVFLSVVATKINL